ncbi:hypothetical protein KUV65_10765 [Maritalea mobilis]|uniref:hypothetical protein n=1 Tax=Maritalea mobilis TaxID=483324 RepID=UPI001C97225E|nr:hypothetical protein [Maritalea mobilis]MBY6201846.1 hypothetical protein [Maritalea mobilis]
MLSIFASSLMTATRQKDWDAPDQSRSPDRRTRKERRRDQADTRRWLRNAGVK